MKKEIKTKKEAWLHAVRLRTLPLALASIFAGSFLAAWQESFRWEILVLASLTTIFLQILSNLSNDYGDTVHGADSAERQGPVRAVQSGLISLPEMKRAMYLFGALSLVSGLLLLFVAVQDWKLFALFLGLGLAAIWAAITYTSGSNPYGYAGLGDISVFVFFGLLGVLGTFFLHTLSFEPMTVIIAISLGCFSTAVLNINNIRDIESDEKAGKRSIPVRIGRQKAIQYNWALIMSGNFWLIAFTTTTREWYTLLAFLAYFLMLKVGVGVQKAKNSAETDPYLKKMAMSTLLWVILFGIGLLV
ncbi:MAG: 1,4-dihydroxy-2-naphthoate polyprenyltransferase [Algoriphagus sp.]|uniref:1,4-dihydroxy-2-naphthoate polyprenyltransferase n=1 Tax=Algoriphagus sp. TaxID=1872435 RepID=UPI002721B825|nr:1,4-dihydroxy-2-naphthoate polyprenyltransferase [Algoriphagus sp.]MDO8965884.1 1,4-dihydroxy-2-naphthoate polyprenyltransferase [Algoriphagus sp.]MDP2042040.1 1,4-dihydroxy-2-naphthoate polyprenyltransferase [Algoriphagus sp.]MDP3201064.1 1,4-dihydroxy-2-naphthoate polyprenyltransferase [Algoriphagus sp.]MDP3473368.1 1,4-dihydroxy-2-naphthoate polyprenyltransferase [Algoriphagus sp.]